MIMSFQKRVDKAYQEILESVKDAKDAMKNAEVDTLYYVQNPDKKTASAYKGILYKDKKTVEKLSKKTGYDWDVWMSNVPKKYKIK